MKARIKKTGEIVEVFHEQQHGQKEFIYKEAFLVDGRMWHENELDFITEDEQHWQDVRERAAIAAMQGTITILSSADRSAFREIVIEGFTGTPRAYPNEVAEFAVACADALVKLLKGK